jgi:ATP/maltotriose-dependent transcriptional regulator MalT
VAEYLLAEVLDRQPEEVRRLLLRTSVLEQVNGELADLLSQGSGGERVLQDLEQAGAFVVSLDPARSWFRYHRLFADLLQLEGALLWFLLHPAPDLLERHARQGTAHAALIAEILDLQAGKTPAPQAGPRPPLEPLSGSEIRVLRYLPTHLSAPEIAGELSVSTSTVKTHLRNLYAKLGVHSRAEAVGSARTLGLLAPSARSCLLSVLSSTNGVAPDALDPGFHCVGTHWIRGFMAFQWSGAYEP